MKSARRDGFSLLEVLMATSILLGGIVVLSQIAGIGNKNALKAEDLSTAQRLCESKLNELISGVSSIETVEEEPFETAPEWLFSVETEPIDLPHLAALTVTVWRDESLQSAPAENSISVSRFRLVRWIKDPFAAAQTDGLFGIEAMSTSPQDLREGL